MPNLLNQPFSEALRKQYPPPEGIKIFNASESAAKMLAFWSIKQTTKSVVLRIGDNLARFVLHSCPRCGQHLSAQAVRMSQKEREMIASLAAMLKPAQPSQTPSKTARKQAKQAPPVPVPVLSESDADNGLHATEDELTLEELDKLTRPTA